MANSHHPLRIFGISGIVTVVAVVVGYFYGGFQAAFLVLLLGIFETSVSFDNAVINARILEKLSDKWQKLFLTVGILIAVFGMRLLFPLLIVGVTTGLNPFQAFDLAMEKGSIDEPGSYAYILHEAHPDIAAFGGMFLLMLFLDWVLDPERDIHWLRWLERPLAKLGEIDRAPIAVALIGLVVISQIAHEHTVRVLVAGLAGMVVYLVVNALGEYFENRLDDDESKANVAGVTKLVGKAAFFTFLYLEVIDASFSFDGVIGAFAITSDPIIIALGLGLVGAMFVRSITIFLVRKGTLNDYVYLDHGAHWAIGALAVILIVSIAVPVPEIVTGLIGVVLIVAAFITSVMRNKRLAAAGEDVSTDIHAGVEG